MYSVVRGKKEEVSWRVSPQRGLRSLGHYLRAQSQFKDLTSSVAWMIEALKEELSATSTCTLWGGKTKRKSAGESVHSAEKLGTLPAGTKPVSLKTSHHRSIGGERRGKEEALDDLP